MKVNYCVHFYISALSVMAFLVESFDLHVCLQVFYDEFIPLVFHLVCFVAYK